jgi:glyoxylase-like metal-dependent hydrolase (beta-lactamase superfamily II)
MPTKDANGKDTLLKWDVFITPGIPVVTSTPAPNTKETFWNPTSSTLIYGERDAVLVDVPTTWHEAVTLARWVRDSCKNLTTIYVTHGHGDHWFGVSALLDRFPNAKVVATPGTVKVMREEVEPRRTKIWNAFFPGQIPNQLVIAEELEDNTIELEGKELRAVELGHTDWQETTCLYVPSIGLAVVGDAAFNGTHMFLGASSTPQKRKEWISALNKIESLNPRAVIAGHKRPGTDDDPRIIEETRQYIRDFDRLAESSKTARELYDQMLKLHPDGSNPHILWLGALSVKGER